MKAVIIAASTLLVVTGLLMLNARQQQEQQLSTPQRLQTGNDSQSASTHFQTDAILTRLQQIQGQLSDLKAPSVPMFYNVRDGLARHEDRFWDKFRHQVALKTYDNMLQQADQVHYDARALHSLIPVTFECDRNNFQR